MKKRLLLFLPVLILAIGIFSCSRETAYPEEEPDTGPENWTGFLNRAKRYFGEIYSPELKTRTALHSPAVASLSSLEIDPDWEHGLFSENDEETYLEFPLFFECQYGVEWKNDEVSGEIRIVDRRLVIREDRTTGELEMFTSFWIPDDRESESIMPGLTLLDRTGFTGRIYLFYPDGQFCRGAWFEEGLKKSSLIIAESDPDRVNTRGGNCVYYYGGVRSRTCFYDMSGEFLGCTEWHDSVGWDEIRCDGDWEEDEDEEDEGGGPGVGPSTPPESRPTTIENDCSDRAEEIRQSMGTLANSIQASQPYSTLYVGFGDFVNTVTGSPYEHGTSYYHLTGKNLLSPLQTNHHPTSVNITFSQSTIATLHNHPDGTPPSATDLIHAGNAADFCDNFQAAAIYNPHTGGFYMICVDDAAKAAAFSHQYASQVDPATNWWKAGSDISMHLKNNDFSRFPSDERQIFQLADILTNLNSGMRLVEIAPDGTSTSYGVIHKAEKTYKTPTKCSGQ